MAKLLVKHVNYLVTCDDKDTVLLHKMIILKLLIVPQKKYLLYNAAFLLTSDL